jgi:formylmethanofuran dehydrogenase subunit E
MRDLIQKAVAFHGHHCPGLEIGCRAAAIAMRELEFDRAEDEEVVAICETDACGMDAVQALTGCTLGKGNLIFRDWGKQVYIFGRRKDGKAIRIALRYDAWPHREEMSKEERRAIAFERLNSTSDEELFDIRWIEGPLPEKARVFKTVRCAKCGEGVMEPRARLSDGQPMCAECYGPPYTRGW